MMDNVTLVNEWEESLTKLTFMSRCEDLRPLLERNSTKSRRPIPVTTQVSVTLYYLSDEGRDRKSQMLLGYLGHRFRLLSEKFSLFS